MNGINIGLVLIQSQTDVQSPVTRLEDVSDIY